MKGLLYGIGTGPGDPELLTLRAIRALRESDVIALPNAGNDIRIALGIVEEYVEGKPMIDCSFSMDRDENIRKERRAQVAEQICDLLDKGKTIGFITLGDPTVYSTYMYVHHIAQERGYNTQIISGIPSFIAAAAALNISLCEGGESLHILPGAQEEQLDALLAVSGNKVIMKSGKNLETVLRKLQEQGKESRISIVEKCGMQGEKIYPDLSEYSIECGSGYFSIVIVKE